MGPHDRLRQARSQAGFRSAAQAAKTLAIPYGTYAGHENGSRNLGLGEMGLYAEAFRVDPAWLAFGKEDGAPILSDSLQAEGKTERVQLLMAPSELKAIDDWSFENRIRGRAEAIRRLCAMALAPAKQDGTP